MVPTVPALGGIPAGPELLVILFVLVFLFGVPIAVIAGVVLLLKLRSDAEADGTRPAPDADSAANAERIAELEAEVERLREKVDDETTESDRL